MTSRLLSRKNRKISSYSATLSSSLKLDIKHQKSLSGRMERKVGFEPTTITLATWRSTPELHPQYGALYWNRTSFLGFSDPRIHQSCLQRKILNYYNRFTKLFHHRTITSGINNFTFHKRPHITYKVWIVLIWWKHDSYNHISYMNSIQISMIGEVHPHRRTIVKLCLG